MNVQTRHGDWIQTFTGKQFWPLDPRPEEVSIGDIAHALSNLCRYAGHTSTFYSVAQHSVLVARSLPSKDKLWGLLHDAPEAYVVDIPRPLKRFLPGYADIESNVMRAIAEKFGLQGDMPASVKDADNAILVDEMSELMGDPPARWGIPSKGLGVQIAPTWSPTEAKNAFMGEFLDIWGNHV